MTKAKSTLILYMVFSLLAVHAIGQASLLVLNQNWKFRQSGTTHWLDARVPGTVHTDLLANKMIEDPYYRANEKDLQWIGEKDWEYTTSFLVPADFIRNDNIELVCKGLDTYADVYLNDSLVITANNMHSEWRKTCKSLLRPGENDLLVRFKSVFKMDTPKYLDAPYKLQAWPNNDQGDQWISLYARKAGFEYGWDWGPRLITSGIWRDIQLEGWSNSRINNIQVVQEKITKQKATLKAVYEIESDGQEDAVLSVLQGRKKLAGKKVDLLKGQNKVTLDFDVLNPELWWSNGLGEAHLYSFRYTLENASSVIDSKEIKTGIRSLKIIRDKDQFGQSFYVLLNGVPVFIKGSNYIPNDNFLTRVTNKTYESVINAAKDAHMNMLRVWGGGIYENDIFYDLCDQNGILVWQDMMFACGMFPGDTAFVENVKHEVTQNVTRLRNHPCIALWCGNNENVVSWYGWGWKNKYPAAVQKDYEASMHRLFHVEIPQAIYSADSSRYYHPSSPNTAYNNISGNMGDAHYYGVWSAGAPFEAYNQNVARFMSEYGFQSLPGYRSVTQFTEPGDRSLNTPVMLSHQRAKDNDTREDFGNRTIRRYMDMYFKAPKDFTSFLYVSQLLQAKAVITAIEAHRRNMPYCMGTMYWQLNDCWPVASWSGIDYFGRWKALHYAVRDAYKKEMISVVNEAGKLNVYIATDGRQAQNTLLELRLLDFDGNILSEEKRSILLQPNTSRLYFQSDTSTLIKGHDLSKLVFSVKLRRQSQELATKNFYFLPEKDLELSQINIDASIEDNSRSKGPQNIIIVKSSKLARSVCLSFKSEDVLFSENYFDLLPGEEKKITINHDKDGLDIKDLEITSLVDSYIKN